MPLIELQPHGQHLQQVMPQMEPHLVQQMIPQMAPGGMGYSPIQQIGHRVPTAGPPGLEPPAPMNPMMQVKVEIIGPGSHLLPPNVRELHTPRRQNRNVPVSVEVQSPGSPRRVHPANVQLSGAGPMVQRARSPEPKNDQPTISKNDCGCLWFACPFCNGGKVPEMDVSCIPLGAWCGVSQCLRGLKFRTAAYPFDWNRVSMDGVIHFLENRFDDFLQWTGTKDFPWDPDHGGKTYCGEHHSFWHDDLTKPEEQDKYRRRIDRFFNQNKEKLLFIRAANELTEVPKAEKLLQALKEAFPNKEIWLLMIIDHQPAADSFVLEGTEGRLMMHLTDKRHIRTWMYYDDVKAYDEAILTALGCVYGRPMSANGRGPRQPRPVDSLSMFAASLEPFYAGNPSTETWDPKPCAPQVPIQQSPIHRVRNASADPSFRHAGALSEPVYGTPLMSSKALDGSRTAMMMSPSPQHRAFTPIGSPRHFQAYPHLGQPLQGQLVPGQPVQGQSQQPQPGDLKLPRRMQSPIPLDRMVSPLHIVTSEGEASSRGNKVGTSAVPQSPRMSSYLAQTPRASSRNVRNFIPPADGSTKRLPRCDTPTAQSGGQLYQPTSVTASPQAQHYRMPHEIHGGSLSITPGRGGSMACSPARRSVRRERSPMTPRGDSRSVGYPYSPRV